MAGCGFVKDDDTLRQIEDSINDLVAIARSKLYKGDSSVYCDECGKVIPVARRIALKGVKTCVKCASALETKVQSTYNRRGCKDSQLR